jgi:hypothetical protein
MFVQYAPPAANQSSEASPDAGLPREDAGMEGDSRHSAKKNKSRRIIRITASLA